MRNKENKTNKLNTTHTINRKKRTMPTRKLLVPP